MQQAMKQMKKLTEAEREAITAKYQRRIIELGIPIFGMPDEAELAELNVVGPFDDPNAEERAIRAERGRAKSAEFQRRIVNATIEMLEALPPEYDGPPKHRKPGDLNRTAERLRNNEVDLADGFDREEEAALLDQHAEFERAKIEFGHNMDAVALEALNGLLPILEAVKKFATDVFHLIKEWAREDPEGPAAGYYAELNRAWRQGAGRSRGR